MRTGRGAGAPATEAAAVAAAVRAAVDAATEAAASPAPATAAAVVTRPSGANNGRRAAGETALGQPTLQAQRKAARIAASTVMEGLSGDAAAVTAAAATSTTARTEVVSAVDAADEVGGAGSEFDIIALSLIFQSVFEPNQY